MMSSHPEPKRDPEGSGAKPPKVPGWRQPWDTWRVLMFGGSLVLLTLALARALKPGSLPGWAQVAMQAIGYVLLAVGFFLAMKLRREMRQKVEKRPNPRGRG